jgi:hypothetical protein
MQIVPFRSEGIGLTLLLESAVSSPIAAVPSLGVQESETYEMPCVRSRYLPGRSADIPGEGGSCDRRFSVARAPRASIQTASNGNARSRPGR